MKKLLIETLEKAFNYPVILQGTMADDEPYPEHFFTVWENQSADGNHYDNNNLSTIGDIDINFYSNDPETIQTRLIEAKQILKEKGFIISGEGADVPSDEATHTGRGINALYMKF